MYRKGLDASKTYYQIQKEEDGKEKEQSRPNISGANGAPIKRGRGRPRKCPVQPETNSNDHNVIGE